MELSSYVSFNYIFFHFSSSIYRSDSESSDNLIKRDCAGFPCMYAHMAEKAGRASLFRALARIIDDCAANPYCNPGIDPCVFEWDFFPVVVRVARMRYLSHGGPDCSNEGSSLLWFIFAQ